MLEHRTQYVARAARVACICTAASLAGCATGYMSPAHPFDYILGTSPAQLQKTLPTLIDFQKDWDAYDAAVDEATRRRLRDKIVTRLRVPIDDLWRRHVSAFYGNEAMGKTVVEGSSATLAAAAAITTPAAAAAILSALSASITAIGTSAEKNFLQQQSIGLIFHQMEADVQLYGEKINQGLQGSTTDYPLGVALADLALYARSMSIPHAIGSINAATGAQSQAVKEAVKANLR
jgi:hypothetical protein